MTARSRLAAALVIALGLGGAWLIPATAAPQAPEKPAVLPETTAPAASPTPPPRDRAASPGPAAKPDRRGKGIRTLDEITIEGEIAVPQVLFITARDRQRYHDFLHRQYLMTARELGRETVFPEAIGLGPRP